MTTLFTVPARRRAARRAVAALLRWATLAARRRAVLALRGKAHSPLGALLDDILGRLGAALRGVACWVARGWYGKT